MLQIFTGLIQFTHNEWQLPFVPRYTDQPTMVYSSSSGQHLKIKTPELTRIYEIINRVNKHNVVDEKLSSVVTLIPHSNTTTSILISMATQNQLQIRSPPPTTKTKPSDWARHWWRLYWRSNFRLFYIFLMADSLNNNNDHFLYSSQCREYSLFLSKRSFSICNLHSLPYAHIFCQ